MSETHDREPSNSDAESLSGDKRLLIEAVNNLEASKIPLFLRKIGERVGSDGPSIWPDPDEVKNSRHEYSEHERAYARLIWGFKKHRPGFLNSGLKATYFDLNAEIRAGTDEIRLTLYKMADRTKTEFEYPEGKNLFEVVLWY